jgi:hypothetical protein
MYKNFNITESEKKEILNMHKSHGYRKPLNEGMGMIWLTKIKIDSPKPLTDEEKLEMASKFQNSFNGRIAVEFGPNEWYDYNGRIEDIQKYEDHINNEVYGQFRKSPNAASFEKEVRQSRRDPNLEQPYDSKYTSFDDYQDKGRKEMAARLKDFNTRRENGTLDEQSSGYIADEKPSNMGGDLPTSDSHEFSGYRIQKREPGGINLQEQLLFIIENLDGRHTESPVGREHMMEVLKETIRRFVNPNDTISSKEWNSVYYPITKDEYA